MLRQLAAGAIVPAEAATKIATEEIYHLRHTGLWLRRMGLGTDEPRPRPDRAGHAVALCAATVRVAAGRWPADGCRDHPRRCPAMARVGEPDAAVPGRVRSSPAADALPRRDIPAPNTRSI